MALDTYLGDLPLWGDEEAKGILESLCTEFQVDIDVFEELVQMQVHTKEFPKFWID